MSTRDKRDIPGAPARKLAVLACMDARLDPAKLLGLDEGDAHVIRNAGGDLPEPPRHRGDRPHTDCGMLTFTDDELADRLEAETGQRPDWPVHAFDDLDASLRASIDRIKASPFLPRTDSVRGYVYEVESGRLREVS